MKRSYGITHLLIVIVLLSGLLVGSAFAAPPDSDNDGVPDSLDVCPTGTRLKELVPMDSLGTNRFALVNGDRVFDTTPSKGKGPQNQYSVDGSVGSSTCGCSCEQIVALSSGEKIGFIKFGCTIGIMDNFVNSRCLADKDNDGYTVSRGDCNDNNPAINPGAVEACNGLDDDCDGAVDDGIAPVAITCGTGACAGTGQQVCVNGQLQSQCTPIPAGTACGSPGSACMNPDTCDANGQCQTGIPVDCDDDNACTNDACNPIMGCVHIPVNCNDGIDCTIEACDQATGQCVSTPDNSACPSDRCHLSSCDTVLGCVQTPVDCDDGNPCTDDTCNTLMGGCLHLPVDCNDGVDCTTNTCDRATGQCVSTPDNSACPSDRCHLSSCDTVLGCVQTPVDCDDGNPCTDDTCNTLMGGCLHLPVDCNDGVDCTTNTCDRATGQCVSTPDNSACSGEDRCHVGSCVVGQGCVQELISCDDGDACTRDTCNPTMGCVHLPVTCDDGKSCTIDSCNTATGCQYTEMPAGAACNDGNACTAGDSCSSGGVCQAGSTLNCDDGKSCTIDSCNTATGCQYTEMPAGAACNDGDACTMNDQCDSYGQCSSGVTISCDLGNPCEIGSCDPQTGCVFRTKPAFSLCDDGNACTIKDVCDRNGQCSGVAAVSCDSGNPCEIGSCDPQTGCVFRTKPAGTACDDGNACTVNDQCLSGGVCQAGTTQTCIDGNSCTADSCDPARGCQYTELPAGAACNDGNLCTVGDSCSSGGVCAGGLTLNCNDGDGCTADSCDAATGCQNIWTGVCEGPPSQVVEEGPGDIPTGDEPPVEEQPQEQPTQEDVPPQEEY